MTNDLHSRDYILKQLQILTEQVDARWDGLTNRQVTDIKNGLESLWSVVCRRKGGSRGA